MYKLIFCDKNKSLVKKVDLLFKEFKSNKWDLELEAIHWDIFEVQKNKWWKIVTASNPQFTFWWWLDAQIKMKFPNEIINNKEFEITENLFKVISVNLDIKCNKKILERALIWVLGYRSKQLIISWLGTSIGGLSEDDFLEVLKKVLYADLRYANLHSANLRSADLSCADLSYADLSCADLSYADLHSANLRSADLRCADLSYANLHSADLRYANLHSADLSYANLHSADLHSANLHSADLRYANLHSADLRCAYLSYADLHSADLSYANLHSADLRCAYLSSADLRCANLHSADLSCANLHSADLRCAKNTELVLFNEWTWFFSIQCPEEWEFTAWKKCINNTIVKLLIPKEAKRSSATTRKCRASKAKVIDIYTKEWKKIKETFSTYDKEFIYKIWKIVKPKNWYENNRWIECGWWIHFFITRKEAEQYN
jgi:uncharacterized protein YjbI with pentapeptide repeats